MSCRETSLKSHITLCKVVYPPHGSTDLNEESVVKEVVRLEGAHGEEVVRDIWWDDDVSLLSLLAVLHRFFPAGLRPAVPVYRHRRRGRLRARVA